MTILMLLFIVLALTIPSGCQSFCQTPQTTASRAHWTASFIIAILVIVLYLFRFGGTIAP